MLSQVDITAVKITKKKKKPLEVKVVNAPPLDVVITAIDKRDGYELENGLINPFPTFDTTVYGAFAPISQLKRADNYWDGLQGVKPWDYRSLTLDLPTFEYIENKEGEIATITTTLDPYDSWGVFSLLSQLPSYFRKIEPALSADVVYPRDKTLGLVFNMPITVSRALYIQNICNKLVKNNRKILLFDADLPYFTSEGDLCPTAWLWDMVMIITRNMDATMQTDSPVDNRFDSDVYTSGGKIWLVKFSTTPATDYKYYTQDIKKIVDKLYYQGTVMSLTPLKDFRPIAENIYVPDQTVYYDVVKFFYNL